MVTNNSVNEPTAASGKVLQGQGVGTTSAFSTATYPATTTINQILYSSANNTISGITAGDYGVLISSATGIPSWLANGTTGQILTATTSGIPSWENPGTASITITGDSGGGLTSSSFTFTGGTTGLTFSGSVSTETLTGTLIVGNGGTGNASQTAYSLVCGGTTSTGVFQAIAPVATGEVLVSGGTGALPAFSANPTVTSITFGAGNALNSYVIGTFTPTLFGSSVAGATTYSNQQGYYITVGNITTVWGTITGSAATGSGGATIGGFPNTIKNQTNYLPAGSITSASSASWTWPAGATQLFLQGGGNSTTAAIGGQGSAGVNAALAMANAAFNFQFTLTYQF